jgi:uroporphyrinogen decarboxylase
MHTMKSRERVIQSLNFKPVDRVPKDLGAMASSSISGFAYPKLVKALGLPPRLPRMYDTHQMLAMPDLDVLDALGCDVVTVFYGMTNAFEEPQKWHPYDFNGRLAALVRKPEQFQNLPDGGVSQPEYKITMPISSHVFNAEHSGMPLDFAAEIPLQDLKKLKEDLENQPLTDQDIKETVELCKRARESSDRAVFFNGPFIPPIAISAHGGLGVFPMLCLLNPDYVLELHDIHTNNTLRNIRTLLPEIKQYIDIAITGGDDWGTQNSLIASPDTFRKLFRPYRRKVNDEFHSIAPECKTFIHSCGAIYDLLDDIIASGFDILNPVQWPAGGHSYKEWKEKCRKRIALWGGGVNAQHTLPLGTVDDVATEVGQIVPYLAQDSGYVFNCIHNILAETPPEKIIAMYRTAHSCK